MVNFFKKFLKEEDGLGTVEIVIIIAVLVAVAILFRRYIIDFVQKMMGSIFGSDVVDEATNTDLGGPK